MSDERWSMIKRLYDGALGQPPHARWAWLEARCGGDSSLRDEVLGMLRVRDEPTDAMPPVRFSSSRFDSDSASVRLPSDDLAARASCPRRIGRYTTIRVLGSGGMGVVYEAEQDVTRRRVAIKEIRDGLCDAEHAARFRREAEILGGLRHPGIATIVEAHIDAGSESRPYLVIELVKGAPLDAWLAESHLDCPGRVDLLARICEAVGYAHRAGVMHRDLKPGNILVDDAGQPKVVDFGLARDVDRSLCATAPQTQSGQFIGTVHYASPEQAAGRAATADARSDVYSLGVIGFELCTGRRMAEFMSRSILALRDIAEGVPALEALRSREASMLDSDLRTILVKALRVDPADRYQDAGELASDLRRHLQGRPIAARPPSAAYRARKFAARHRRSLALVSLVTVAAASALLGLTILAAQRDREIRLRQGSKAAASIQAAARALREGRFKECLTSLEEIPATRRHWEWHWLHAQADRSDWSRRGVLPKILACLRWPDPPVVAVVGVDPEGRVAIVEPEHGRRLAMIDAGQVAIDAATLSLDGRLLFLAVHEDGRSELVARSLESNTELGRIRLPGRGRDLSSSTDGRCVVAGVPSLGHETAVDPLALGALVAWVDVPHGAATEFPCRAPVCARCSPDGRAAVVSSGVGPAMLVELSGHADDSAPSRLLPADTNPLTFVTAWSHEANWLVTGRAVPGSVGTRELRGRIDRLVPGAGGTATGMASIESRVCSLAVSPDDRWIASAHADGAIRLVRNDAGAHVETLPGHREDATRLCFNRSSERLVSVDLQGAVRGWTVPPRDLDAVIELGATAGGREASRLACAVIAPRSAMLHAACADDAGGGGTVLLSDLDSLMRGERASPLVSLPAAPVALASAADGSRLVVAAKDGSVWIVRISLHHESAMERLSIVGVGSGPRTLAIDPAGSLVASITASGAIDICSTDLAGAGPISSLRTGSPLAIAFLGSPLGRREAVLIVATAGGELLAVDAVSGRTIRSATIPGRLTALDTTPGSTVVVVAASGQLLAWDLAAASGPRSCATLSSRIDALEVSSDSQRIAAACEDRTVNLVDATTGELLVSPRWDGPPPVMVEFAPDPGGAGEVQRWRLAAVDLRGRLVIWGTGPHAGSSAP